jgi:2-amino-4-hydroxy-6-hydroxymethyldihydropteridine diphosphokinase
LIQLQKLAIVALGSNLGDSRQRVVRAMDQLQALSAEPVLRSSLWQTTPVDCPPDSPHFVNAVVGLVPLVGETPESLLAKLQAIEREFGRQPKRVHNEPRPIDLDLITFGSETRATKDLVLPHPRAHLRRFVLEPLNEIAPEVVLPGQTGAVHELLNALSVDVNMRRVSSVS